MDDLQNILARRARPAEPPEMIIIKEFMEQRFATTPVVAMNQREIIIGVKSSALAGALRPYLLDLQRLCDTDRRLIIRIQQ